MGSYFFSNPKTKFLKADWLVTIYSFKDEVIAKQDDAKTAPFRFIRMTDDEESWTHVQAIVAGQASIIRPQNIFCVSTNRRY